MQYSFTVSSIINTMALTIIMNNMVNIIIRTNHMSVNKKSLRAIMTETCVLQTYHVVLQTLKHIHT